MAHNKIKPYERGSGRICAIKDCTNSQRKLRIWKELKHPVKFMDCHGTIAPACFIFIFIGCMFPYHLHRFPENEDRRRVWVSRVNRKDFHPSGSSVICSNHFLDGQPTTQNPDPVLHLGYGRKVTQGRRAIVRHPLTDVSRTTENHPVDEESQTEDQGACQAEEEDTEEEVEEEKENKENTASSQDCDCCKEISCFCFHRPTKKVVTRSVAVQVDVSKSVDHHYAVKQYTTKTKTVSVQVNFPPFSADSIKTDTNSVFYTGLSLQVFLSLVTFITSVMQSNIKMPLSDQILLTLMRLRLGIQFHDLGRRFSISMQLASKIFGVCISVLSRNLKDCIIWLPRDVIRSAMPMPFKTTYPHTTCIIDCTEIFLQRPFSLKVRAQTYSTYKSHNTAKSLVAIAPNGYIMYVSRCFGGRASDVYITKN